jgi:hypothetical protein
VASHQDGWLQREDHQLLQSLLQQQSKGAAGTAFSFTVVLHCQAEQC